MRFFLMVNNCSGSPQNTHKNGITPTIFSAYYPQK
jgi:hypothetical protein